MRRLWLIFSQTATVCLAVLFVVSTLRPDLLGSPRSEVVTVHERVTYAEPTPATTREQPARIAPATSLRARRRAPLQHSQRQPLQVEVHGTSAASPPLCARSRAGRLGWTVP